jgi:hypothetical protein
MPRCCTKRGRSDVTSRVDGRRSARHGPDVDRRSGIREAGDDVTRGSLNHQALPRSHPGHAAAVAAEEQTTMQALWYWLIKRWREHRAITCGVPSHRIHLRNPMPVNDVTEADYLRWLIESRPWP